jgi:hypothetical protein
MSSDAKFPYCSLALRKHVEENDQWSGGKPCHVPLKEKIGIFLTSFFIGTYAVTSSILAYVPMY